MKKIYIILFIFILTAPAFAKNVVGVLLPTSGTNQIIGNIVKNAVIMATYKFATPDVEVRFYDTESSRLGTVEAYEKALEDNAKVIVGPISGSNTTTVRSNQKYGVPVLSLSNNSDVGGSGVFTMGYTPQSQGFGIVRIMKYLQIENAIAIIPQNKFGSGVESGLSSADWGQINRVYYYNPELQDFKPLIERIVEEKQEKPFDAIILPDSNVDNVKIISSQLSFYEAFNPLDKGDKKVFLIGGLGWFKIGDVYKEPGLLNGYYLSSPQNKSLNEFKNEYKSIYGHTPHNLAVLAYDMTALAIIGANAENPQAKIMQEKGFKGISGTFRMGAYGVVERIYDIRKVFRERTKKILQVKTYSK